MSTPSANRIPINPGGTLSPAHVLARDELITRYWEILEHQSMTLLAPRRVGKTSICRRMADRPPPGSVAIWRDLEGRHTGAEFVRDLYEDCEQRLSRRTRASRRARSVLEELTGTFEIAGFKLDLAPAQWSRILDSLLEDLANSANRDSERLVLMWDEFTWFLSDLLEQGRAGDATTLLDRLRAARQAHPELRMVFTGSIGLRGVLNRLEQTGYSNQPMNDVAKETVPLFDAAGARLVARSLLANLTVPTERLDALTEHLADATEGHPLLLHSVVQKMKFARRTDLKAVDDALRELLEEENDPLELNYYIRRLALQLPPNTQRVVEQILDELAPHPGGLPWSELQTTLGAERKTSLDAVNLLRHDHYIVREGHQLRFRMDFLRRYWLLEHMLDEE